MNYVSMVGWSYDGVKEFFSKEELERLFVLEKINKAPGVFDYKKLYWYNGMYIRAKSDAELVALITPYLVRSSLVADPPTEAQHATILALVPVVKERLKVLSDVVDMTRFVFADIPAPSVEELLPKNQDVATTLAALQKAVAVISDMGRRSDEELEQEMASIAQSMGIKINGIFMPVRMAVTGSTVSPPLFDSIRLLGFEHAMVRLERAVAILTREMGK
jgi:glutamyl-tRNA synthetase